MKLVEIYGEDIIIVRTKDGLIITFHKSAGKIVSDSWFTKKLHDEKEERKSKIKEAAEILLEDIKLRSYNIMEYPPTNAFFEKLDDYIPETLKIFLEILILNCKSNPAKYQIKMTAFAHALISIVRPRSFLSTLQIGLEAVLLKQYGSKELLEILNSLGFCSSYSETQLFESSVIRHQNDLSFDTRAYTQFVYDNADNNISTIDGRNTFHAMGGIQIVTPHDSVTSRRYIAKYKCSAAEIGEFGRVPLKYFRKPINSEYKKIVVRDLSTIKNITLETNISATEFLWFEGKQKFEEDFPGWNGYMEKILKNLPFNKSKILFLNFINNPASDRSTVLTALKLADDERIRLNQKNCFVTFDQPLYHKSRDIIECLPELSNVIVRLGGFHLLMSFMGSVGYIMDGSGLKDLFNEIYTVNSVNKILSGHAYARAVRGHFFTHLALGQILLSTFDVFEDDDQVIHRLLDLDNDNIVEDISKEEFNCIYRRYLKHIQKLKENEPTSHPLTYSALANLPLLYAYL